MAWKKKIWWLEASLGCICRFFDSVTDPERLLELLLHKSCHL